MSTYPARSELPLFEYPRTAGFKELGTSREAARAIEGKAKTLRDRVLAALKALGPMTADQCAEKLEEDRLAIRPRFSELHAQQLVVKTGERRTNESGLSASVWRAA